MRNTRKLTELLYATSHDNETKDSLELLNISTYNYNVFSLCYCNSLFFLLITIQENSKVRVGSVEMESLS